MYDEGTLALAHIAVVHIVDREWLRGNFSGHTYITTTDSGAASHPYITTTDSGAASHPHTFNRTADGDADNDR